MNIQIKEAVPRKITFTNIQSGDMFVFEGRLYLKWNSTNAVCLKEMAIGPRTFEMAREVKRIVAIEVTTQDF